MQSLDVSYEKGLEAIVALTQDAEAAPDAGQTEADTRAKLIDRILRECLGWTEAQIQRELHHESGFSDYVLSQNRPVLVVEAKRENEDFSATTELSRRDYALATLRAKGGPLHQAIEQARSYADDEGVEFAVATNGRVWAVFRALSLPGAPWRKGRFVIFRSLEDVQAHFDLFWGLLSEESVRAQSLPTYFQDDDRGKRIFKRALDQIAYADEYHQRNELSSQLQPFIEGVFQDLTREQSLEILRSCYILDKKIDEVADGVAARFQDTVPDFAKQAGFMDIVESPHRSGAVEDDFRQAVSRGDFGTTILLLGGIGCGKTTFIHRLLNVTAKSWMAKQCVSFYIPFTEAPPDAARFDYFVRERIVTQLRARYAGLKIHSLERLRDIFSAELEEHRAGVWSLLTASERNKREADFLERQQTSPEFVDAVLRWLRRRGIPVAVTIDNVDQRPRDEQIRVFFLAHQLCVKFDAVVLVALREESFFEAQRDGAFNAYHNIRYHISSPDARKVIKKRLGYARKLIQKGEPAVRTRLGSGANFNLTDLGDFLLLVNQAVTENPAIAQFVDSVSAGNTRFALEMFNSFLVSGATWVEKMLGLHRTGGYRIAEHEFVKSVMLGDFQFYRAGRSPIVNLFDAGASVRASNMTMPRILDYLLLHSGNSSEGGVGFVELDQLLSAFSDAFRSADDARDRLTPLLRSRLVETENRQATLQAGARRVRVTSAGEYYRRLLCRKFVYLDLVSLDTPIWEKRHYHELHSRASRTSIPERATRVLWLLSYLECEERRTLDSANHSALSNFSESIAHDLRASAIEDMRRVYGSAKLAGLEELLSEVEGTTATVSATPL